MDIKQIRNMANQVESYGRYGDTELVHLNPIEVAGLASLSPTGQLTINPVTGKKEAFLPLLIPLLASWGGSALAGAAGAGAIGTAIAGGLASGVATGALTGDWERGLASGIMGAGLGGALGAAGSAAGKAGAEGAAAMMPEATQALDATVLGDVAAKEAAAKAASNLSGLQPSTMTMTGAETAAKAAATPATGFGSGFDMSKISGDSLKQAIKQPWNAPEGQGMMHSVMQPQAMLPISIGGSELARLEAEDDQNSLNKKQEKEDEEDRYDAYERLQAAYRMAQPGLQPRQGYGNPYGMAAGGAVPSTTGYGGAMPVRTDFGKRKKGQEKYDKAMDAWRAAQAYGGLSPLDVQKGLRGAYSVTPPANYRPGFDPEFMYFQDDPANIQTPALSPPTMYKPLERLPQPVPDVGITSVNVNQPQQPSTGKAGGGMVNLRVGNQIAQLAAGGIADVPNEYTQPPQSKEPNEQDIQQLALALTGKAGEQADQIVQTFVQKYGPEMFTEVRKFILQQLMPNAQTEGMIKGQGGGMDDQVQGTIGGEQPVAVSPGEYIVPADVVSGIGDGSSDAGAKRLDEMQSKVRMARGGGTTQPPPIDFGKMMPI